MTYKTHQMTALAVTSALLSIGFEPAQLTDYFKPSISAYIDLQKYLPFLTLEVLPIFILFIVSFGALIPNLDHSESYISRKLRIISFFTSFFKHRGPTHRLDYNLIFFTILILLCMEIFNQPLIAYVIFWLGIGSILHIFGDMHTKSGVKLFGKKVFRILPKGLTFTTNSPGEGIWLFFYTIIFLGIISYQYGILEKFL